MWYTLVYNIWGNFNSHETTHGGDLSSKVKLERARIKETLDMPHDWSALESVCALVQELRTAPNKSDRSYGVIFSFLF